MKSPVSDAFQQTVASARECPQSLADLFLTLTVLALQGFGGVMAIVQHELVERKRWLTREEFVEEWAVAQIMPGPNVVNLCLMIGARYFGARGALVAVLGLMAAPSAVILLLAVFYVQFGGHPMVVGALRGMGAVAAGLVIATGLKLFVALKGNPLGALGCAIFGVIGFVGIALLRLPLIYLLLGPGMLACLLAYRKIGP